METSNRKNLCLCVSDDIFPLLKWMLGQYKKDLNIMRLGRGSKIEEAISMAKTDILIVDCPAMAEPPHINLQKIKTANPGLNILLIVPPVINKEEALSIIRERLVKGMVVLPFSAEIVCGYLDRMSAN